MTASISNTRPVVGDVVTKRHIFRQKEFNIFADISGDDNPIHVDPDFSAQTRFGKTVSHGMLIYSHFWGMIQTRFPQAVQEEQIIKFPAPTFTDEEVLFEIKVSKIDDTGLVHLDMQARTPSRETVGLEGSCIIKLQGGRHA